MHHSMYVVVERRDGKSDMPHCATQVDLGELRKPHTIDNTKCIMCRECKIGCPKNAIKEV